MNKWMKTYWRQRHNAKFARYEDYELSYAKKINDEVAMVKIDAYLIEDIKNAFTKTF